MYGLVNRAIEQMVISKLGPSGWRKVCHHAGLQEESFLALQAYPDDMTYRLVGAVCNELEISSDEVLEAFGEYWILYTAEEGYGALLLSAGNDVRTFLHNLDELHARVETIFPDMVVPWFQVEDIGELEFFVHYGSRREGLAPMVTGLLKGLVKRFGQEADIRLVSPRTGAGQTDIFHVRLLQGA